MSRSLRTRPLTLYASRESAGPSQSVDDARGGQQTPNSASRKAVPGSGGGSRDQGLTPTSGRRGGFSRASEVGSNLKKRLSMRYAEPTELGPGGYSTAPALPPMPHSALSQTDGYGQPLPIMGDGFEDGPGDYQTYEDEARQPSSGRKERSSDERESRIVAMPSASLSSRCTGARAKSGQKSAEAASFHDYHDFIRVSKEISSLENEMLELKELVKEWKSLPHALQLEETEGGLIDGTLSRYGRGNRNSALDLQQIYRAQIMSLWEGIEGSQKFLPYIPGRHLIAEASSFTELNAATYKPKQGVALFLLDDLLLVAVRKKRQMSARVRLVAERCFSLGEIVVIDLKDGGDLTNAVKIKRAKETFVYRTERAEDKRALLNAFRKVAEELASKRRKESVAEAEARKRESTLVGGPTPAMLRSPDVAGDRGMSAFPGEDGSVLAAAAATAASEKKDPGRWINDFADELAVAIALREWSDAVAMVEKGKGALSTYAPTDQAHRDLAAKLNVLTASLVSAISHDLSSPFLKKSAVVRNAALLLRLDKGEKARELFLAARSELLRRRSRQIKFEGDVSLHISELALVHFTLVKNTSEWYMSAFKDNRMASGFVRWAAAQIEAYAEIFRRQVYGVADQEPKIIAECIEITKSSANQLRDVGLSFGFLLDELLRPDGLSRPSELLLGA
ncbi:hypothetical protein FA09DRAFT_293361 [Tilletiopsis washingtonensis]|uniref:Exocyst complex component EXO84 n=1 Tax=Tilletiopsis washingtonensis TaxID=58919 RepID=A0A316ZH59_9BASI|nr:hypothetical protein FA09DRAFT_293361 [Tilletiopsis washingtonensis]PWO00852.1 hypothetical protein FA09DRAFT_293361 [Tilletiopsis washingtonensis]